MGVVDIFLYGHRVGLWFWEKNKYGTYFLVIIVFFFSNLQHVVASMYGSKYHKKCVWCIGCGVIVSVRAVLLAGVFCCEFSWNPCVR